jgi:hypothetical protein
MHSTKIHEPTDRTDPKIVPMSIGHGLAIEIYTKINNYAIIFKQKKMIDRN